MSEVKRPSGIVTVIIRDDSPMVHSGDSPSYRTVRFLLEPHQLFAIGLKHTSTSAGVPLYEEISRVILE